eukprot:m.148387 g.148387  ORF g.148387 m.148387 type:complete len:622 (-) comp30591_c0_seq2:134-1999(-)
MFGSFKPGTAPDQSPHEGVTNPTTSISEESIDDGDGTTTSVQETHLGIGAVTLSGPSLLTFPPPNPQTNRLTGDFSDTDGLPMRGLTVVSERPDASKIRQKLAEKEEMEQSTTTENVETLREEEQREEEEQRAHRAATDNAVAESHENNTAQPIHAQSEYIEVTNNMSPTSPTPTPTPRLTPTPTATPTPRQASMPTQAPPPIPSVASPSPTESAPTATIQVKKTKNKGVVFVEISAPRIPGAVLYFTTDGSDPVVGSADQRFCKKNILENRQDVTTIKACAIQPDGSVTAVVETDLGAPMQVYFSSYAVSIVVKEDVVERRKPVKQFVYVMDVKWSEGTVAQVSRSYTAFYNFHVKLLEEFPQAAGTAHTERLIPYLPGKAIIGNGKSRKIMQASVPLIDAYIQGLLKLPTWISRSSTFVQFFEVIERRNIPQSTDDFEQFVAIHDYPGDGNQLKDLELGFISGQHFSVVQKRDDGWWYVFETGNESAKGWVPKDFLKEVAPTTTMLSMKYLAIDTYQTSRPSELSFETGDILLVSEKRPDGWWKVTLNGQEGWAPASFLKDIQTSKTFSSISTPSEYKQESRPGSFAEMPLDDQLSYNRKSLPKTIGSREEVATLEASI